MESRYRYERRGSPRNYGMMERFSGRTRFRSSHFVSDGDKKELATKMLFLDSKKFYLDLIRSSNGKLMKITEVSLKGQKFRLVMRLEAAADIYQHLIDFSDYVSKLTHKDIRKFEMFNGSNPVKTARLFNENRKYYLDLINFTTGLFLKIAAKTASKEKNQVLIPASGIESFTSAVHELLDQTHLHSRGNQERGREAHRNGADDDDDEADDGKSKDHHQHHIRDINSDELNKHNNKNGDDANSDNNNNNNNNNKNPDPNSDHYNNDNNNYNYDNLEWEGQRFTFNMLSNQHFLTITQENSRDSSSIRVPEVLCRRFAETILAMTPVVAP